MTSYQLIATAAAGIESLVANELKDLGYQVQTENGRVRFQGSYADIVKTNLWLRTADRIKIIVGEFHAKSFESLFDQTYALDWAALIPMDGEFPVAGKSIKSQLSSVPAVQRIIKKAISKKLMDTYSRRGKLPETGALYPLEVAIRKDHVMLTLDTSGTSLFKRGYRAEKGTAPLKENFAAALIQLTTWHPDRPLYDPTCGSGTILIEAALMGHNIAPGLFRSFSCEDWIFFDQTEWQKARSQARAAIKQDAELNIYGTDVDQNMIAIAKENADKAGVLESIRFKQINCLDFQVPDDYGILISNPPYGDRMSSTEAVHKLYRQMGDKFRPLTTWSKYFLTSDEEFENYYGQKATKKRKLYNGALRTDYYQYWGKKN
ncbi:THUMP domain-containing class I SAM-dependent RNA methyltransferase [Eremococcus coleocola]|uniref:THUMP domain-containing protein n=1 Tax=Eremococcus coleocola ACS-139-V-Col8 TaxID=908337 RepID=E4KM46_9LACT|nr:class I SAM-dependent RNA methyltransferase [Eremococcus coleocola]EFR32032.1 hypothetical protein HMPREF9257_1032 [Eremococcus coleocola ACS-139-V-Col8]